MTSPNTAIVASINPFDEPRGRAKTSMVYSGNNKGNDVDGLLTIEELLQTTLRKEGFGVGHPNAKHTISGVRKVNSERGSSVSHSTSSFRASLGSDPSEDAQYSSSYNNTDMVFGFVNNPIVLREDESRASEAEIDCGSLRAKNANADQRLFSSIETACDERLPTPPSGLERESSTFDFMRPSSEPLHGCVSTKNLSMGCARPEPATSFSARHRNQSPRPRASQHKQLSQEDHLHTGFVVLEYASRLKGCHDMAYLIPYTFMIPLRAPRASHCTTTVGQMTLIVGSIIQANRGSPAKMAVYPTLLVIITFSSYYTGSLSFALMRPGLNSPLT